MTPEVAVMQFPVHKKLKIKYGTFKLFSQYLQSLFSKIRYIGGVGEISAMDTDGISSML